MGAMKEFRCDECMSTDLTLTTDILVEAIFRLNARKGKRTDKAIGEHLGFVDDPDKCLDIQPGDTVECRDCGHEMEWSDLKSYEAEPNV
ncbi:hypothetical protein LCGC14_0768640 [marine sediment metagenome]|uniref:Uncharacterized protein n=1 Tax=marine sediment metagenome TaxID=412755 RepID=A0A0F9SJ22_9ZZZZ